MAKSNCVNVYVSRVAAWRRRIKLVAGSSRSSSINALFAAYANIARNISGMLANIISAYRNAP